MGLKSAPPEAGKNRLAFFAHERGDARVRKRLAAFQDHGWQVTGLTFHRVREKPAEPVFWENVELGETYNGRYVQRALALARAIGILWKHRRKLRDADVLYAVNSDNAVLAWIGGKFAGSRAKLVLELADIQPAMIGNSLKSRCFRWAERLILSRTAVLVTTSPGFVREYFSPLQRYAGEIFLLENKIYPDDFGSAGTVVDFSEREIGNPWRVGCFGAFRCARSLGIMKSLAERFPGKIEFVLRGYPSGRIAEEFAGMIAGVPGIQFAGSYQYPGDLLEMYSGVDFVWAIDESDPGGNSAWLLPNRIYEGGRFGVPMLAAADTETAAWIARRGAGWVFPEPLEDSLAEFFAELQPADWQAARARCVALPIDDVSGVADYWKLSDRLRSLG